MSNGPIPFSDIGRRAKDLLYKDYNFDQKFSFSLIGNSGKEITATGVKNDQVSVGDLTTRHKHGRTTVDVKVDSNSNISTTVTVNEIVTGLRTSCSLRLPDQKSGKLAVQYLHDRVALNSSVGLTSTPLLELAATVGNKELTIGAEFGFDSASATFPKYNAGIGYNKDDFSASLVLADKGETFKASYIQVISPATGTVFGAEVSHRLKTKDNNFTIGCSHSVDAFTTVKSKLNNSGKVAVLCQREWRPKSLATVSAEYDPKAASPSRFGFSLAVKP